MNINVPKPRRQRPPIKGEIRTDFDGYDFKLLCPRCGDNYLHHCAVSVFSRPREDGPVTVTTVHDSGQVEIGPITARSPSSRRDGLTIAFWCECCGATDLELAISQHKGNTHAGWRQGAPDCGCPEHERIDEEEDVS
jgi:hypothetical protein